MMPQSQKSLKMYGEICDSGNLVTLGAEDFANYMEHVPGCFVFIGTDAHEWHHPAFLVDDAAFHLRFSILWTIRMHFRSSFTERKRVI